MRCLAIINQDVAAADSDAADAAAPAAAAAGWGQGQGPPVGVPFEDFFSKKMAVVAPPGAVATALRHVRYQKQARSASDTRPHRAVPVDGAHRSRSLTCILTPDNDAALARCKCTHSTLHIRRSTATSSGGPTGDT